MYRTIPKDVLFHNIKLKTYVVIKKKVKVKKIIMIKNIILSLLEITFLKTFIRFLIISVFFYVQ